MAEFRAWIEPVHLDEGTTIPFRLVGELVHEAAPPVAEYGTVHRAFARLAVAHGHAVRVQPLACLPRHVPYHQGLHADELVLFYQPVGQLVLEVIAVVAEPGVRLGHDRPLSAVVVRPFRSTGQFALLPFDILLQSAQPVRIVDFLAGGQREEILDAQVDADTALGLRFRLDVHVEQEHEIVRPVLTFHRPAGQVLDRITQPVALADAHRAKLPGQRVPVAVHTAYRHGIAERLDVVVP